MVLVYAPTLRLDGATAIVSTDGVVLALREAEAQLAPFVLSVKAVGVGLKTSNFCDAGTVPPI